MNDDFSDLYDASVENLGTEGYCDLAAEVLHEFHPDAHIFRITDSSGDRFVHIFIMLGDTALDITGPATLDEMLARHADIKEAIAVGTTPDAVAAYFCTHGRERMEHQIVTTRFRDHIQANRNRFLIAAG